MGGGNGGDGPAGLTYLKQRGLKRRGVAGGSVLGRGVCRALPPSTIVGEKRLRRREPLHLRVGLLFGLPEIVLHLPG